MLRAAIAALSIASIGPAFAGDGDVPAANTFFTELPGVIAQAPVQNPSVATAQSGQATHILATQSNRGTWLYQGGSHEGANS
jgi:hypothetical protein